MSSFGRQPIQVASGNEALDTIWSGQFDIILLDDKLPDNVDTIDFIRIPRSLLRLGWS